ncbi:UNVERIFIED_CONTAM: hypothetical protein K2H54_044486 [Gekko kuhli]
MQTRKLLGLQGARGLELKGQHFQYNALPFVLASSLMVFSKALVVLIAYLLQQGIHLYSYLDDILHRTKETEEMS